MIDFYLISPNVKFSYQIIIPVTLQRTNRMLIDHTNIVLQRILYEE